MTTQTGRARVGLVVDAVAQAFLSPISSAALAILIATRTGRAHVDQHHLMDLLATLTHLDGYAAEGPDQIRPMALAI